MDTWAVKQLGEVCSISTGKLNANAAVESGKYPFFTCSRETFSIDHFAFDCEAILLAGNNAVGDFNVKHYKGKFNAYQRTYVITIKKQEQLLYRYLYLQVENGLKEFKSKSVGAGTKFLKLDIIKGLKIPLPPLSEQKRIVSIVDEAFEGIDRAIANTQKNVTNARELFASYLNAIFTQKGNGWVEKKLGEIGGKVFTGPFGSLLHKADYIPNGIPIVNPANIEDDEIVPNFNKTVSQDVIIRLQAYVLSQNDIVIGRRGEIGRCAVVREEHAGWLCGSGSFFIKTFENVDSVFLTHLFRSAHYRNQLEALSAGATMQNLSNQALSGLLIAMPPLDEQNKITDKLDDLKTETQRLEAIYRRKLAALNELKQSILQKAFTGELTADTANQATKTAKEVIAA
jgi:type I restriction enzyme, S subunit